jgi:hypothetical protein
MGPLARAVGFGAVTGRVRPPTAVNRRPDPLDGGAVHEYVELK